MLPPSTIIAEVVGLIPFHLRRCCNIPPPLFGEVAGGGEEWHAPNIGIPRLASRDSNLSRQVSRHLYDFHHSPISIQPDFICIFKELHSTLGPDHSRNSIFPCHNGPM